MEINKNIEKLNRAEGVLRDLKTVEVLKKADSFLSHTKTSETLSITCKSEEQLSAKIKIGEQLKIFGKMLGVGRHKKNGKYYTKEDLIWSVNFHKGKGFPVKLDHKDKEVGATIGRVDEIYWDEELQLVMYRAHINDITQSLNVLDGVVTDVSATIASQEVYDEQYGLRGQYPEYTELSLVEGGAFKENNIQVV